MPQSEVWYRYDAVHYAPTLNEFDEPCGDGRTALELREFPVLKTTPKGVWIESIGKRFVLRTARKRYACPTKQEAIESFRARKKAHIRILKAQLRAAEAALSLAETGELPATPIPVVVFEPSDLGPY